MQPLRNSASGLRWAGIPVLVAGLSLTSLAAQEEATERPREEVATMKVGKTAIEWLPVIEHEGLTLTVSGAGEIRERVFKAGTHPTFELRDEKGQPVPDGSYSYELTAAPKLDPQTREKLAAGREAGDEGVVERLRQEGLLPRRPLVQSGVFSVWQGQGVDPSREEPGAVHGKPVDPKVKIGGDITIWGDLSVRGSQSFAALDPEDPGRAIYFGALGGPEVGTYFRGSAKLSPGEAVVELPEYFAQVTEERGLTVQLTPVGGWGRLYVAEKSVRRLVIRQAEGGEAVEVDFLVQGVRKGYADFEVVRDPATDRLAFPELQ